ncbi:oligosaccharide flippase family protein [Candidatus Woesebacteria bacterium]|nr:oligosaccharide flippase family protein [Candidatus Woesebacteria bacterium]MCD8527062.1 oligosaccharide flippase family protein [Candidatus Woesebacteria bacterium]
MPRKKQKPSLSPEEVKNIISTDESDNLEELTTSHEESDTAEIKKRSIAGVLSYMGRSVAVYGIVLVANFLLAAFLSPDDFGIYYLVTAVLSLFTFLSDIGLASALIQKKEEPTKEDLRTTFTVQQILAILIFVVVVALTPYWTTVQNLSGEALWLLYIVAASFFVITFKTIPSVLLSRQLRFDLLAIPSIVENMIFYGIVTLMAWRGFGVQSFIWGILARDVAGIAVMYSLQRWPFGIGIWRKSLKELMSFGFRFQLNDLLARVKDDLITIVVVGAWLDPAALGYIGWAKRNTNMPQQFTVNNITAITFPTFARLQHDKNLLRKAIEKTIFFISLVNFPLLAGMALFFYPLVTLIPEYNKWQPALIALALFAVNIAWGSVSTPLTNTLNAIGHVNKTLILMVMWTVLTWILTPLGIYYFGYTGVALASALIGFSSVVTVWMVQQVVPFSFFGNMWRQLLATTIMTAFGWITMPLWMQSLAHMAVGIVITGSVFAIVFLLIGWKRLKKEMESLGLWPLKLRLSR